MKSIVFCLSALLCIPTAFAAEGTFQVEEGFLSMPIDKLTVERKEEGGIDLIYMAPQVFDRLGKYTKVMIDQPEVWIAPDSKYGGIKPDNIKAIADITRESITTKVVNRGYEIADQPGAGTLYMRIALTDLYLQKKKRGVLGYTPVGAVAKLGSDALKDVMEKVDVIEAAIQVELQDSVSQEVLGAIVVKRGARKNKKAGQKLTRYDFEEFRFELRIYGARLACRLDNAKVQEAQRVNCIDIKALEGAGYIEIPEWY